MEWLKEFAGKSSDFLLGVITGSGWVLWRVYREISDAKWIHVSAVERMDAEHEKLLAALEAIARDRGQR